MPNSNPISNNSAMTDGAYLEMANHAKTMIDNKEIYISHLKDKFNSLNTEARKIEYIVFSIKHIINFKLFETTNISMKKLLDFLMKDLEEVNTIITNMRDECSEIDDSDNEEDVILMSGTF